MLRRLENWVLPAVLLAPVLLDRLFGHIPPLGEASRLILAGWFDAIQRDGERMEISPAGIATGVICTAAALAVVHYLGKALYADFRRKNARADWPPAWRWQWSLAAVGAVVLMFSAGLCGVGLFRTTTWCLDTPQWTGKGPPPGAGRQSG